MKLIFHISVFLWISISVVIGLFTVLKAKREVNAYQHIFQWLLSPVIIIAGLVFIDKERKKQYFRRVRINLFIK